MAVLAAVMLVLVLVGVAFAVDLGYLFLVRTQAQVCADAAAMAAAWEMASEDRILGDMDAVYAAARDRAAEYAELGRVDGHGISLLLNEANDPEGEIVLGRLDDPANRSESLSLADYDRYNTVLVRVRCNSQRNGSVGLFFAPFLGISLADVGAEAAASFDGGNTVGFRITEHTGNPSLMPFAMKLEDWEDLLQQGGDDDWSYDPLTQNVSPGNDGKPEVRMFPERHNGNGNGNGNNNGGGGITPGNFGTVDIGNPNNAAPDLWRQIREGPSARDLSHHGGEIRLDPNTGSLTLNGDTGVTASMAAALSDIVGKSRTIFLYDNVTGQGNNTYFNIVGLAGVRIVDFNLNGGDKYIRVQPAVVVDETAIVADSPNSSYFIGPPVRLVR